MDAQPKRTYTISEAAELTGVSRKAIARRVERGSIQSVLRDGRRRIPRSELVRSGLLPRDDERSLDASRVRALAEREASSPSLESAEALGAVVRELLDRLERQATEISQFRALTVEAESLRLTNEIADLRARIAEIETGRSPAELPRDGATLPRGGGDRSRRPQGVPPSPRGSSPHAVPAPTWTRSDDSRRQLWLPRHVEETRATAGRDPRGGAEGEVADARSAADRPEPGRAGRFLLTRGLRLGLEAVFIGAVALAAWRLDLEAPAVVLVVGLAWVIAALFEWLNWRAPR